MIIPKLSCLTVSVRVIAQKQNGGGVKERNTLFYHQSRNFSRQLPATQPCTILQTSCSWNVCTRWVCKRLYFRKCAQEKQLNFKKGPPQWEWGEDAGGVHSEQGSKLV